MLLTDRKITIKHTLFYSSRLHKIVFKSISIIENAPSTSIYLILTNMGTQKYNI